MIPDHVYQKIFHWINKSNFEVSGFGSLDFDEKNRVFTVRDAILLKQKNTGVSSEIDEHAIGKAMYQMRGEPNALKWHWHSHVNMPTFWSGDDMELIRSLGYKGWILASVFNKSHSVRTAFCTSVPILGEQHEIFVDEIATTHEREVDESLSKKWDKEYKELVKEQGYTGGTVHYQPSYWDKRAYDWQDDMLDTVDYMSPQIPDPPIEGPENEGNYGFDVFGMKTVEGGLHLYNPCRDYDLAGRRVVMLNEILELSPVEMQMCLDHDPDFKKNLDQALLMESGR